MSRKQKQALRSEMRLILSNIDTRWLAAASRELCLQLNRFLLGPEGKSSECILAWTPYFRGEPDLTLALTEFLKSRRVFLPRIVSDTEMVFVEVKEDWSADLEPSSKGVLHPKLPDNSSLWSEDLAGRSAILVPGLAFDRSGGRIGRGKGFYDRFLDSSGRAEIRKIGICWSLQVVPEVPVEGHDVLMDLVCHERGVQYLTPV